MSSHLSKTDSHLYRPAVAAQKKRKEITTTSSSTNFTSTLSSLISSSSTRPADRGRPRPSKSKQDIFSSHNKGAKARAKKDLVDIADSRSRVGQQDIGGVDEATLALSKRKLAEKAKRYKELKSSNYVPEDDNSLIEWDRKWVENPDQYDSSSSDSESEIDDTNPDANKIVEYEDEFGRLRKGTVLEKERHERMMKNRALGAEELERISARPAMPENLIVGPTIQVHAFNPDLETERKMEELAKKRDKSPTPPPAAHYDASKEIRSRGTGFYQFSQDEEVRKEQLRSLEAEREETERLRKEREEEQKKRKREEEEMERRGKAKRAKQIADSFLEEEFEQEMTEEQRESLNRDA